MHSFGLLCTCTRKKFFMTIIYNFRSWAAKVVGHVWWLFALILVSAYTANFIALRTRNKIISPIRSAADLLESGYHNRIQYGTVYGSSTYEFFQVIWFNVVLCHPLILSSLKYMDKIKNERIYKIIILC